MNVQFVECVQSMRRRVNGCKILSCASLLGFSAAAAAHPGHSEGFLAAFAHPFSGLDHLLMMLFVGIWAGRSGGSVRWLLPASFLSGMAGGWLLGVAGMQLPGLESGIAATLIVLGVLLALQIRLRLSAQMGLVAAFALLHGLAHGGELFSNEWASNEWTGNEWTGSAWPSAAGMLLATALLHAIGVVVALSIPRQRPHRVAGALLAVIGGGLLAVS